MANVDIYYEKWVKECAESSKHSDFQKLWEVLMIRVTSEAICETAGSMMNQHCGKIARFSISFGSCVLCEKFNKLFCYCKINR